MATVNIIPAFTYKWAQTGTVEAIDDAQYKAGWSFIGATPPSVEQFNKVHQVQDEKSNWLYQQLLAVMTAAGETPTVGDLTSLRDAINVNLDARFTVLMQVNGWQRLSSGLILQWGAVTGFASYTINFPIAYPTNPFFMLASNNGTAGTISATTSYINNSSFGLYMSASGSAYWFSIGR